MRMANARGWRSKLLVLSFFKRVDIIICLRRNTDFGCAYADGKMIDDFEARSPDELSLQKGERIELIERDDDFGDGWYLGKHAQNGRVGLFPEGRPPTKEGFVRNGPFLTNDFESIHNYHTSSQQSCRQHNFARPGDPFYQPHRQFTESKFHLSE